MKNARHEFVVGLVSKYPEAPVRQLASIAMQQGSAWFKSYEDARSSVRYIVGSRGVFCRKNAAKGPSAHLLRERRKTSVVVSRLPKPWPRWAGSRPFTLAGPANVLVLQDLHVPFHDQAAIEAALNRGLKEKVDVVLLNGDICDFYDLSMWEKDPRQRDFKGEIEAQKQMLEEIVRMFAGSRIIFKPGNHEERYERYLSCKAPELLQLPKFSFASFMEFEDMGIELVPERATVKLGKLHVIHGHEYRFAIQNPVSPARGLFLRAKDFATCGHFHQSTQHQGRGISGKVVTCFSSGCLCDLNPRYLPHNEWSHGFQIVRVERGGGFHMSNLRIIDGKIY